MNVSHAENLENLERIFYRANIVAVCFCSDLKHLSEYTYDRCM